MTHIELRMSNRTYTDAEFVIALRGSKSWAEVAEYLGLKPNGYNTGNFRKTTLELGLDAKHIETTERRRARALSEEYVFSTGSRLAQGTLRDWALKCKVAPFVCAECGTEPSYNGKPLTLQLDHVNGDNSDNRKENLRFLCPNCHSQTQTWCRNTNNRSRVTDAGSVPKPKKEKKEKVPFVPPIEKEELAKAVLSDGFEGVGRKHGVSGNCVKKWCKRYKLEIKGSPLQRKAYEKLNMPHMELQALLLTKASYIVAEELGVGQSTLRLYCAANGIKIPQAGYYARLKAGKEPLQKIIQKHS